MAKQIFDQDRPRSTMAKRLDEAFAGCDVWTAAPPSPRRDTLDRTPRPARAAQIFDGATFLRSEERPAA
jgi:hypothetical protein